MPLLDEADPLPFRPHRVLVAGASGAGETTLAWRTYGGLATRMTEVRTERPALVVVRLTSHAAARRWLAGPLAQAAGAG